MNDNEINLDNLTDGFMKGNLFKDLYRPYKNYTPKKLEPQDEKSRVLLDIDEVAFAMHEINLYLDLHPDDDSMIALFNDYRRRKVELTEVYESKYGPLTLNSEYMNASPFLWESIDFPFGGSEDVGI